MIPAPAVMARPLLLAPDPLTDAQRVIAAAMSEADLQTSIVDAASRLGWFWWHDQDSRRNRAGLPDLILIRERVIWAELKDQRKALRPDQRLFRDALRAADAEWYLWRPANWLSGLVLQVLMTVTRPARGGRPG